MHELRKDPLMNRWIAVMSDSMTPADYHLFEDGTKESGCVLCSGREKETPPEITAIRGNGSNPNEPGWMARVIPSFKPILHVEGDLGRRGIGMYDKMNSIGANEIIIESPSHDTHPEDAGIAQMIKVATTYKNRVSELEKDSRFRYTFIYKDCGKTAGELYHHPHSQVIATPVIPKGIKEELDGSKAYYYYKERCVYCDIINEELRAEERIIMETKNLIAFSPFAPRVPFEFWILPKRHSCAFQDIYDEEMEDLSLILMTTIKKMKTLFKNPPYNYVLHTAPNRMPRKDHWHTLGEDFHWHMEVTPHLVTKSGFEWDSELYILTTSPEDAAKHLKEA